MVEVERRDENTSSLITDSSSSFADSSHSRTLKRTGTLWTAIAHIINGVIGTAVLSLAWSVAQLGWIAGPICMLVFGVIAVISSNLLCDCYRYPHPEVGHIRNRSFAEAVRSYLGKRSSRVAAIFVQEIYYGSGIAFAITSAISMRAILKSNCYHKEGPNAPCEYADGLFMLLFGIVQVLFSQIPDLHNMQLLSIIAAIMSFGYTLIGPILAFAKVVRDGEIKGGISGVSTANLAQKLLLSSQAIGDVAFAFTYSAVLLDIQDTLKAPPPENRTMKKASITALLITTTLFICCGCFGYAAFGNQSPGNLLTGFYEPYWLVDIANLCIVLHLLGAYQINTQPLYTVLHENAAIVCLCCYLELFKYYSLRHLAFIGMALGFTEVLRYSNDAATTKQDNEEGVNYSNDYFQLLLTLMWVLSICCYWQLGTWKPINRLWILRTLQAYACIVHLVGQWEDIRSPASHYLQQLRDGFQRSIQIVDL